MSCRSTQNIKLFENKEKKLFSFPQEVKKGKGKNLTFKQGRFKISYRYFMGLKYLRVGKFLIISYNLLTSLFDLTNPYLAMADYWPHTVFGIEWTLNEFLSFFFFFFNQTL